MSKLVIGSIEFSHPTLLILGDRSSLRWLARTLSGRKPVNLADFPSKARQEDVRLFIEPGNGSNEGIKKTANGFTWGVSRVDAAKFYAQIKALAETSAGHAYLDASTGRDEIQVMVSMGEYPDSIFVK